MRNDAIEQADLMSAGRLFQIAGAAHRKAREPVTVLVRVAHSKLELELRRVRGGLYIIKRVDR